MVEGHKSAEGDPPERPADNGGDRSSESAESPSATPSKLYELASKEFDILSASIKPKLGELASTIARGFIDIEHTVDDLLKGKKSGDQQAKDKDGNHDDKEGHEHHHGHHDHHRGHQHDKDGASNDAKSDAGNKNKPGSEQSDSDKQNKPADNNKPADHTSGPDSRHLDHSSPKPDNQEKKEDKPDSSNKPSEHKDSPNEQNTEKPDSPSAVQPKTVKTETISANQNTDSRSNFLLTPGLTLDGGKAPLPSSFQPTESKSAENNAEQKSPAPEQNTSVFRPTERSESPETKSQENFGIEPKRVTTVSIAGPAPGYSGPTTFQPSSNFDGGKNPTIVELKTRTVDPESAMSPKPSGGVLGDLNNAYVAGPCDMDSAIKKQQQESTGLSKNTEFSGQKDTYRSESPSTYGQGQERSASLEHGYGKQSTNSSPSYENPNLPSRLDFKNGEDNSRESSSQPNQLKSWSVNDVQAAVRGDSPNTGANLSKSESMNSMMFNKEPIGNQNLGMSGGVITGKDSASERAMFSPKEMANQMDTIRGSNEKMGWDTVHNPNVIANKEGFASSGKGEGSTYSVKESMANFDAKIPQSGGKEFQYDGGNIKHSQDASRIASELSSGGKDTIGNSNVSHFMDQMRANNAAEGIKPTTGEGPGKGGAAESGGLSRTAGGVSENLLSGGGKSPELGLSNKAPGSESASSTGRSADASTATTATRSDINTTSRTGDSVSTNSSRTLDPVTGSSNNPSSRADSASTIQHEMTHNERLSPAVEQKTGTESSAPKNQNETRQPEQPRQSDLPRQVVPGESKPASDGAASAALQKTQISDSVASVLARSTNISGGASLDAVGGAKSVSIGIESGITGSDRSGASKVITSANGIEITGPVSLSTLAGKATALALGDAAAAQSGRNATTIAAAAEAAIGNAALAAKAQAAIHQGIEVPSAVINALAGGKGIFDAQANKGLSLDANGKAVQANLNPNISAAINAAANAGIGNVRIGANNAGVTIGAQASEIAIANAGARIGRAEGNNIPGRIDGKIDASIASRLDPVTGRIIAVPGQSASGEFNINELTRIQKSLSSNDKRYLTGVEIALAVAIASAAVAKARPEDENKEGEGEDGEFIASVDSQDGNNQVSHYKRPTYMVAHNDTLIDIAERHFNNADVAWLIADINSLRIIEHLDEGKRIVELRSRQEIELPLLSEAHEFLLNKQEDAKAENLITIIGTSEIDRELLNSFLSTVVGGEATTPAAAPVETPSAVVVPERAPVLQPLMALVNVGVNWTRSLMPTMSSLVQQGHNLRTYITSIDSFLPPPPAVHSMEPEPQPQ